MSLQPISSCEPSIEQLYASLQQYGRDKLKVLTQEERSLCKRVSEVATHATHSLLIFTPQEERTFRAIPRKLSEATQPTKTKHFGWLFKTCKVVGSALQLYIPSRKLHELLSRPISQESLATGFISADISFLDALNLQTLFSCAETKKEFARTIQAVAPQERAQAIRDAYAALFAFEREGFRFPTEQARLFLLMVSNPSENRADDARQILSLINTLLSWEKNMALEILLTVRPNLRMEALKKAKFLCEQGSEWRFANVLQTTADLLTNLPRDVLDSAISAATPLIQKLQLASRVKKILQYVATFAADERAAVVRYALLCSKEGKHTFRSGSIIKALAMVPPHQRSKVMEYLAPDILQGLSKDDTKAILKTTAKLIAEYRPEVIRHAIQATRNILLAERHLEETTSLLVGLPAEELDDIMSSVALCQQNILFYYDFRAHVQAVSAIPQLERRDIVQHAAPLMQRDMSAYTKGLILAAVAQISPELRARAVAEAARQQNSDALLATLQRYLPRNEAGSVASGAYQLFVVGQDVEVNPIPMLHTLAELFAQSVQTHLSISYEGEAGIDAGGLGRQFVSRLCVNLVRALGFKQLGQSGLYRPELYTIPFSEEKKRAFRELGQLFMFCLNATRDYPTGLLFDVGMFRAIQAFPQALLQQDFEALNLQDPQTFTQLFALYEMVSETDAVERIKKQLNGLPKDAEERNRHLQEAYAIVEAEESIEALKLPSKPDGALLEQHYETLQAALRKSIAQQILYPVLAPLHELARGMKQAPFQRRTSWRAVLQMRPEHLSKSLQGSLGRQEIISKLRFNGDIAREKRAWLEEWIRSTSDEKIKKFLFALTGSYALGANAEANIKNAPASIYFHACFNSVEIPFRLIETKEQFSAILESCLDGAGFNRA